MIGMQKGSWPSIWWMGSQFLSDEGYDTSLFIGRHFANCCDKLIDKFLQMLIQHEEWYLAILGE